MGTTQSADKMVFFSMGVFWVLKGEMSMDCPNLFHWYQIDSSPIPRLQTTSMK